MQILKLFISLTVMLAAISCGDSSETKTQVASLEHKQESLMIVRINLGEFCKFKGENYSVFSGQDFHSDQEVETESAEARVLTSEVKQLELKTLPNCDAQTISAIDQSYSGESLQAGLPIIPAAAVGLGSYVACVVIGNMVEGGPWEAFCILPAAIGGLTTQYIKVNFLK